MLLHSSVEAKEAEEEEKEEVMMMMMMKQKKKRNNWLVPFVSWMWGASNEESLTSFLHQVGNKN